MNSTLLSDLHKSLLDKVEQQLTSFLLAPSVSGSSVELTQVMRYAVLSGGKRLRPLLTLATGMMYQVSDIETLVKLGCIVELVHCYSLIHDDLPAMDNDDLRRGLPTCHKKYGEALAILAGDALQAKAFELLSSNVIPLAAENKLKMVNLFAYHIGEQGMVGGQALDCCNVAKVITQDALEQMHAMKTGGLIKTAMLFGYLSNPDSLTDCSTLSLRAELRNPMEENCLTEYQILTHLTEAFGLLFQIVDDILDVTADTQTLGKTANKDIAQEKPTYVSILGLEKAKQLASSLYQEVRNQLGLRKDAEFLLYLLDKLYYRNH